MPHNHKYPHFLIKKWNKKPWSKKNEGRVNYIQNKHMGEKDYYPEELERNLSKVEDQASRILSRIDNGENTLEYEDWLKVLIFIKIQAIRLENICEFINKPDSMFKGYNNFLFGINSTNDKNLILETTESLVNIFLDDAYEVMETLSIGLGLVIWRTKENIFAATDNAVFKEVDMDSKFMFTYMPISPKTAIVVSKNSYFASQERINKYKRETGDSNVSAVVGDSILINEFQYEKQNLGIKESMPDSIPQYNLNIKDAFPIVQAMIEDAEHLVFFDGEDEIITASLKMKNKARKINNTLDDDPFFPYGTD